jgi:hypothetical protein
MFAWRKSSCAFALLLLIDFQFLLLILPYSTIQRKPGGRGVGRTVIANTKFGQNESVSVFKR